MFNYSEYEMDWMQTGRLFLGAEILGGKLN